MDKKFKRTPAFRESKRMLVTGVTAAMLTQELERIGQTPVLVSGPDKPWDGRFIPPSDADGWRADQ